MAKRDAAPEMFPDNGSEIVGDGTNVPGPSALSPVGHYPEVRDEDCMMDPAVVAQFDRNYKTDAQGAAVVPQELQAMDPPADTQPNAGVQGDGDSATDPATS